MLAVTASKHASGQSLKLLQLSSPAELSSVIRDAPGNTLLAAAHAGPNINAAITAIMNILLDAQGNANVNIVAKDGFVFAQTGDGDDTINMDAHHVGYVSSGKGNDIITLRTHALSEAARTYYPEGIFELAAVTDVSTGEGNDTIAVDTHGNVYNLDAGDGDDLIAIRSTMEHTSDYQNRPYLIWSGADVIDAGAGDDKVIIEAEGMVMRTFGGTGNDAFDVSALMVSGLHGDEGDDNIQVAADRWVNGVWGGDGNDTIEVTAPAIGMVNGGKGDDTIVLNNTAGTVSAVDFNVGDGHDDVQTNSALFIRRFSGVNSHFDMSKAAVERVGDNTLKITFDDADDSVTIHLAGDMVGKPIALDFYKSGVMVLRRDDSDAPVLPQMTVAANPVVLTRPI